MKPFLKYSLVLVLALGLNMAAHAKPDDDRHHPHYDPPTPHTAPEVDAALAAGGLALVGGTIAVLRARRQK